MSSLFDRLFGSDFIQSVPAQPGIYRVFDSGNGLIYVGKAKNLRRRLSQYRNAKRRKKHFRMRQIVAAATRIDWQLCENEGAALLLETHVIQSEKPRLNISSAFYFMYPMLGFKFQNAQLLLCHSSRPELFGDFELHGCFRSRLLSRGAYRALDLCFSHLGSRKRVFKKRDQYASEAIFSSLDEDWKGLLNDFLEGHSNKLLLRLFEKLVEKSGARNNREEIQSALKNLKKFFRIEASPLARVRKTMAVAAYPVSQKDRDPLFLRYRFSARSL